MRYSRRQGHRSSHLLHLPTSAFHLRHMAELLHQVPQAASVPRHPFILRTKLGRMHQLTTCDDTRECTKTQVLRRANHVWGNAAGVRSTVIIFLKSLSKIGHLVIKTLPDLTPTVTPRSVWRNVTAVGVYLRVNGASVLQVIQHKERQPFRN